MFNCFQDCIWGRQAKKLRPRSPESIASAIVTKILNADTPYSLEKEVNEEISINGWSDAIAQAILRGLENAIKAGAHMAQAASDAATQSKNAAVGFATEHPVYATLIAFGILALLTPLALEVLGFGELGPIAGSFAATWQRTYAGYVPKNALFGYFQKLGMKWHWVY
ncbi:uncharacterized protein N7479_001981 [Penicillium vulpinum]|uniref:Uncharacterized protein n=1 Tax=Penicillium vulpinum TaxID=29845 RepID=A0A1V6S5F6_9EURO|nr:uncharacterized protein N7479_001981 [Penicillium vulpinum]KAJ5972063.1 hypothetical protein N7479_001981 [Penicillium vulpinum]OQE08959.1 hypothetical protein PENVUL_c008G06946 [Penicillium vulpinum]